MKETRCCRCQFTDQSIQHSVVCRYLYNMSKILPKFLPTFFSSECPTSGSVCAFTNVVEPTSYPFSLSLRYCTTTVNGFFHNLQLMLLSASTELLQQMLLCTPSPKENT